MPFDGANLARLRGRRRLTQAALAGRSGLLREDISRWETGDRQPGAESIVALARALRVKVQRVMRFRNNHRGDKS